MVSGRLPQHVIDAAIDAGLLELERQGAVKLPRYCKRKGVMLGRARCECCE